MTEEEVRYELQARAFRQAHGLSRPGDDQPLQVDQPAQAAAPAPAPPPLSFQDRLLIGAAQQIRASQPQMGFSLVKGPTLPPGMNAVVDAFEAQQAASTAVPKPPTVQEVYFQAAVAHREQVAKQPQPLVTGFTRGFLAKPQRPQV